MTREKARKLRELIEQASVSLPDEDALDGVELFPAWASSVAYSEGNRVRYGEKLYRCNAPGHTSQDNWTPDVAPALWTEVSKPGVIPVWKQPLGDQDAYDKGDKVRYPDENGDIWISVFDGKNVWQPGVYGWEKVL